MFHLMPPAGTPVQFRDILRIVESRVHTDSCAESFREKIKAISGTRHCYFLNSGRTAFLFILRALSELAGPSKVEVVIPAYTCFSVAAAIARSNLVIRLIDIDPRTMDYDYEKLEGLDFGKVLAIVGCNMFGILNDWDRLHAIAKEKGIFLIDDAAQSMGSEYNDRASGSLGDAGFYSLGRGKNMSTYSGGVLLTGDDRIAAYVRENSKSLSKTGLINETSILLKIVLYGLFLRPGCYWLPAMIPFLGLGETIFDKDFSIGKISDLQLCAGNILVENLAVINSIRAKKAHKLAEALLKSGGYMIPGYDSNRYTTYLRLPLLASDRAYRDRMIATLRKNKIVASTMYPSTIRRIPGIEKYLASDGSDFPGADMVVETLLTLPTHPYVSDNDIFRVVSCLTKQ